MQIALGLLLTLLVAIPATAQTTWTQGYHDAVNTGTSSTSIGTLPAILWSFGGTNGNKSNACADGPVGTVTTHPDSGSAITATDLYTSADKKPTGASSRSEFYRFDLAGNLIWVYDPCVAGAKHDGLVTVDATNGTVIYPAHDGLLRALNIADGTLAWSFSMPGQPEGGATLSGGVVYYLGQDKMYALDPTTIVAGAPAVLWSVTRASPAHGAAFKPAVSGGVVYWGGFQEFYASNATTGATIWSRCPSGCTITDAALTTWSYGFGVTHVSGGVVYTTASRTDTAFQTLVRYYNTSDGTQVCTATASVDFAVKHVVDAINGNLIAGYDNSSTGNGGIIAFKMADCTTAWQTEWTDYNPCGTGAGLTACPFTNGAPSLSANGRLLALQQNGTIRMLNAATGAVIWSYPVTGTMHGANAIAAISGVDGFAIPSNDKFYVFTAPSTANAQGKAVIRGTAAGTGKLSVQ